MNPTDKKIPPIFFGGKMDLKVDFENHISASFEK